jgi:hypothetical protein
LASPGSKGGNTKRSVMWKSSGQWSVASGQGSVVREATVDHQDGHHFV